MFSAVIKDYFAEKDKEDGKRTMVVSIMPCTAKKGEILRPDNFTDGRQDTDYVLARNSHDSSHFYSSFPVHLSELLIYI